MSDRPLHLRAVEPGETAPEPAPGEEWKDLEEVFTQSEPLPERAGRHLRIVEHPPPLD